ncbi:class E sortase [Ruminococcaceae bacterium OttesenSCG-928-L11]|nr:class E sortase [Ruminococcaceae bacterium OttesenSCG-928-L11]
MAREYSRRELWLHRVICLLIGVAAGAGGMAVTSGYIKNRDVTVPEIPSSAVEWEAPPAALPTEEPMALPEEAPIEILEPAAAAYPPGYLVATETRMDYRDGDMEIHIPRLGITAPVLDGVGDEELARGIGLFTEAQLPESLEVNSNTSIAAHRDVYGMEFYYIHTMEPGDLIHLKWMDTLYTYEMTEQFVTHDADWRPIQVREYPCVTLMSCEPIHVSSHRIFTVGRLIAVTPDASWP